MATKLNTIPAEESDTLLTKKPAASLKFQAHMGAANASTKAKKIVGAVAAAALVLAPKWRGRAAVVFLIAFPTADPSPLPSPSPLYKYSHDFLSRRGRGQDPPIQSVC